MYLCNDRSAINAIFSTIFQSHQGIFLVVYDRNLVSELATETEIRFRYWYRSLNFFYINRNFLHFLFLMLFVPFFDYFQAHTEFSCKTFFNYLSKYLSSYHCLNIYLKCFCSWHNMKIFCRTHNIMLPNLRFYGIGKFRYRPKVTANFQFWYWA